MTLQLQTPSITPLEDGKHIFRTSDRLTWKKCRRQHLFGSITRMNLVPLKPSKPLEFGTDWHSAMAVLYDPLTWHLVRNQKTRHTVLDVVRSTFVDENRKHKLANADENGYIDEDTRFDYEEREALGLGMLDAYFDWQIANDTFTPVKVEVDFEVPILTPDGQEMLCDCHGAPVVYQGRLDGIVKDAFGWYWILEHKTTAQMGATEHLALDEQTGSYAWALMQMLGIRVQGVIYNEAVKKVPHAPTPLMRPQQGRNYSVNKQQDTTYEMSVRALSEAGEDLEQYRDFLEFLQLQGNKFFKRTQVHRNEHELRNQGLNIYHEVVEMLNPYTVPYPNPSRFNCQMCAFRPPCIAMNDGSDWEFLLSEDYKIRTKEEVDARRAR